MTLLQRWLWALALAALALFLEAQPTAAPARLEPGQTIQADLAGGHPHRYTVELSAGQSMRLAVLRPGFATVIRLSEVGGKENLLELHWPGDAQGRERLYWIAEASHEYRLELAAADPGAPAGKYQITLEELRAAAPDDRRQVEAQQAFESARALADKREYAQALGAWDAALAMARALNDRERQSTALNSLGNACYGLSQYEKAIGYYEQALAIRREIKDRRSEGHALDNLGLAYSRWGRYEASAGYYEQALAIRREMHDRPGEGATLGSLGSVYRSLRQYEKAIGYLEQALAIDRELKDRGGEAWALENLGIAYGGSGQNEKAIGAYEQALAVFREIQDRAEEITILNNLGRRYSSLSQHGKAIGYYEQALALSRETKDRRSEGNALSSLGSAYVSLTQFEKAIGYYQQALAARREVQDRAGEIDALNSLGNAHRRLSQLQNAIGDYEQALAASREAKDRLREGGALNALGSTYYELSQYEKAMAYSEQALPIQREVKNRAGEGFALNTLGLACYSLSQYEKAIGYHEQVLAIHREVKDRRGEGGALNNLGLAYGSLSQYEKAIGYYQQALVVIREAKDRREEGNTLNNLGKAYGSLSQYEKAIGYYEQSLAISREVKDRLREGNALNSLGSAYQSLSQYEKAIGNFEQALAIRREIQDRGGEGSVLASLGAAYIHLGQPDRAVTYYQQALAIRREIKNRDGEGNALIGLGNASAASSQFQKAIGYYEQSLAIRRETGNRSGEGVALHNLGDAYANLNQYDKAIAYAEQALAIYREIKYRRGEGGALANLGNAYAGLKQYSKATGYCGQALAIAREIKDRDNEAEIFARLMDVWEASGNPRLAVFYGKQAVNTIQSVRSDIHGLDEELQQSFLRENEKPYHTLAETLIAQGRLPEAEEVLGLLKEQEYFRYVRGDSSEASALNRRANETAEEAEWEKRYREVGDRLVTIGTERGALLGAGTLTAEQNKRLAQLEQDLAAGNYVFEKFLGELATHFSGKAEAGARLEQLRETQGLMGDLGELPAGSVAIYTLVGEDKYRAILVTPQVQKAFEYPITAADLNRKVLEFRAVVRNPRLDPRPLAQELYKILLGNMAPDLLQAKAKTLMWSLDGTLRYLPLAALYDGEHYVVEQYRLAVFTPASNARLKDVPSPQWKVAGFGVTKAHQGAEALPWVADELHGIVLQKPGAGGVLEGDLKLDEEFTQESMRSSLLKRYAVVHIASHFRFQPGNDAGSFLLLGDGSHLSMEELKNLPNLFIGVQLLTLSACNTGVGDVPGDGKEVEGFGVLAQRKGAKSVIASLWPVADASTSLLMQEFYRIRESSPGMTKAEALAQAQIELLRGTAKPHPGSAPERALVHEPEAQTVVVTAPVFKTSSAAPYAHPYYWAPFFLMGNWL